MTHLFTGPLNLPATGQASGPRTAEDVRGDMPPECLRWQPDARAM